MNTEQILILRRIRQWMQNKSFITNISRGLSQRLSSLVRLKDKKTGLNWLKEKYLKHIPAGVTRTYTYKNKKIYFSSPAEFLHTFKEIFSREIYKATLGQVPLIIDCGANIGLSTIYFKEHNPTAHIIAFEPDENNYTLLAKNIESFGFTDIELRKEAVWIEDTVLHFSGEGTMGSRIERTHENKIGLSQVKAVRLASILRDPVAFLKIDIEGAEYQVLKDIHGSLHLVRNLFFEYHGKFDQLKELVEIQEMLEGAGFSFYIQEAAGIYPNPFMANFVDDKPAYDIQLNIFCFRQS